MFGSCLEVVLEAREVVDESFWRCTGLFGATRSCQEVNLKAYEAGWISADRLDMHTYFQNYQQ